MRQCWARSRGGCAGGMSNEHLISRGLFDDQVIEVQGFSWCRDKTVRVGLSSLVSKILCQRHNSQLADVDAAGISAVKALRPEAKNLTVSIDGFMFERWLAKTAINLTYGGDQLLGVGANGAEPGEASPYALAVVFGELPFTHHMGAYFLKHRQAHSVQPKSLAIRPLQKDGAIGAMYFHLHGIDVALSLFPGHPLPQLEQLTDSPSFPSHMLDAEPVYRPSRCEADSESGYRRVVDIDWRVGTRENLARL